MFAVLKTCFQITSIRTAGNKKQLQKLVDDDIVESLHKLLQLSPIDNIKETSQFDEYHFIQAMLVKHRSYQCLYSYSEISTLAYVQWNNKLLFQYDTKTTVFKKWLKINDITSLSSSSHDLRIDNRMPSGPGALYDLTQCDTPYSEKPRLTTERVFPVLVAVTYSVQLR